VVVGFGSVILRIFLIITIVVVCLIVVATVVALLAGMVGVGVRKGHSNVFRSVTKGEFAVALFVVLVLGGIAVFALSRM
jgi:hypothetical protein